MRPDILIVLNQNEPNMVNASEIVESLWASHKSEYESKEEFDAAIERELDLLANSHKIRHVNSSFGTLASKPPGVPAERKEVDLDKKRDRDYYYSSAFAVLGSVERRDRRLPFQSASVWQRHAKEGTDAEDKAERHEN